MKLKFTYTILLGALTLILLQSNNNGRYNKAAGTQMNACGSAVCHGGALTSTIDSIQVQSTVTWNNVSSYTPGETYRIFLHVSNTHGFTNYGWVLTHNGLGTFDPFTLDGKVAGDYWGHDTKLNLLGGPISYVDWTAPVAGSGNVTLSALINAVNNNNLSSGDAPSALFTRTLPEAGAAAPDTAKVSIQQIHGTTTICSNDSVAFVAIDSNGGTAPSFQWKINGTNVGVNSDTLKVSSLTAGVHDVECVMTSNKAGVVGSPATSNTIKVVSTFYLENTITIVADKVSVCTSDTVNFTATIPDSSKIASISWYKNGVFEGLGTGKTFEITNINNNDSVHAEILVSNTCVSSTMATSNKITFTSAPSPVLTAIPDQVICSGDSSDVITFLSDMAGTTYAWTNDNTSIGLGANGTGNSIAKFESSATGGVNVGNIEVIGTGINGCKSVPEKFRFRIAPPPIVRRPFATQFCDGSSSSVNLRSNINGAIVTWTNDNTATGIPATGTGIINFTATNTTNAPIISKITASASINNCQGPDTTYEITILPSPNVTSTHTDIEVCVGDNIPTITFTSDVAGATFLWTNDNAGIGLGLNGFGNIASFATTNTTNGQIEGEIKVGARAGACTGPEKTFKIKVNAITPSEVMISSADTVICNGSSVFVNANPTNGGTAPIYKWFLNNTEIIGSTQDTITINNVKSGDSVHCEMVSNSTCTSGPNATSNKIAFKDVLGGAPSVELSSITDSICEGTPLTINTTLKNTDNSTTFKWFLNGSEVTSSTSDVFQAVTWNNEDKIYCEITVCGSITAKSDEKTIYVFPIYKSSASVSVSESRICSDDTVFFTPSYSGEGDNPTIQWKLNGEDRGDYPNYLAVPIVSKNDEVTFIIKSSHYCAIPRVQTVTVKVDTVDYGPLVDVNPAQYISFCEGDSALLNHYGGQSTYNYMWSNGSTADSFYVKESGSFYLTVTDPSIRCKRVKGPITVFSIAAPPKPYVEKKKDFIRASSWNNYQWQLGKQDIVGADSSVYKYSIQGMYRVKITNNAGCVNYSDEIDPYKVSAGIANMSEMELSIFPNPATDKVYISLKTIEELNVKTHKLNGEEIFSTNFGRSDTREIDVSDFAKGVYIIEVATDTDKWIEKISIK